MFQLLLIFTFINLSKQEFPNILFQDLQQEYEEPIKIANHNLSITGIYYSNGFGKFTTTNHSFNHLFDSIAYILKINITKHDILMQTKMINSKYYNTSLINLPLYRTLGGFTPSMTKQETDKSILNLMHDNLNANLLNINNTLIAISDLIGSNIIDNNNLNYLGEYYKTPLLDIITSAHPITINNKIYNFEIYLLDNLTNYYRFYYINITNPHIKNYFINIPVSKISYIHSFSMTNNYIILIEYPFYWNIKK